MIFFIFCFIFNTSSLLNLQEVFDFGGVLCGSSKSLLYIITNQVN